MSLRWCLPGRTTELFECGAAGVPEDREQRQNEVGLVELDPFAVYPNEDVSDMLLVHRWRNLQRRKRVLLEIEEPIQVVGY